VAISAQNLVVSYGANPVLAVDSLYVPTGASLCVSGRNGSGKSTLLRLLCGLTKPTAGTLTVFDMVPNDRATDFRAQVAGLLSTPPLAADLTLIEHLAFVGASWGISAELAKIQGLLWLDRLDVGYVATSFPHEVSAGERQAFALAMAFARPSKMLILDEPERHLDDTRIGLLADLLLAYQRGGGTVVVASHSALLRESLGGATLELHRR